MRAFIPIEAQVPFSFTMTTNPARLFERVDYLDAVVLHGDETLFHERDDSGYTKAVWIIRADDSREPIRFRMTRG